MLCLASVDAGKDFLGTIPLGDIYFFLALARRGLIQTLAQMLEIAGPPPLFRHGDSERDFCVDGLLLIGDGRERLRLARRLPYIHIAG